MFHILASHHDVAALTALPNGGSPRHPALPTVGHLVIDPALNGPRRSANGGFAAGTVARFVDADVVTVRLTRRVPLSRRLDVRSDERGRVIVGRRGRVIAAAWPGDLASVEFPTPPTFTEAQIAREAHPFHGVRHALSDCVVCGPERTGGMHVTPGAVAGRPGMLAAPWVVDSRIAVAGQARFDAVWAAMDCPSYPAAALQSGELCLLGTITAAVDRRPAVGERLVVFSWTREHHGRRYETSAAIVDAAGDLVARADSTWIALRRQPRTALSRRARAHPRSRLTA